jgi:hypothetical protein
MVDFVMFLIVVTFFCGLICAAITIAVGILRFIFAPIWAVCQLIGMLVCVVGYTAMLPYAAYKDIRRYHQSKRKEERITFQEQVEIPIRMEVKPRRRRKTKVVNMVERDGVYVPENGEW